MEKLIKRIEKLKEDKESTMNEYLISEGWRKNILTERNSRISSEIKFLTEILNDIKQTQY